MKIVLTRAKEDIENLKKEYPSLHDVFYDFPCIEFLAPSDCYQAIDNSIRNNQHFDWLFFLSKRAAETFFDRLFELGGQLFHLSPRLKIACVGESTANFIKTELAFPVDFIPSEFNSNVFVTEFIKKFAFPDHPASIEKIKVILPRVENIKDDFVENFENTNQFEIEEVNAYISAVAKLEESQVKDFNNLLVSDEEVYLSFASSQTFRNFLQACSSIDFTKAKNTKVLSIGPKTSKTILEAVSKGDFHAFELIEAKKASFDEIFSMV